MSYYLCSGQRSDELQGAYKLNMDVIYSGWLVKSPPEKKTHNHWLGKIFQAKWRRRYFVLHAPPASSSLPGCYELAYYDSESCRRKHGSIDVDQCEEIVATLDSAHYQHLFALRTKHRARDRTYYLAAVTEEEMNRWVDYLCKVCGFKPDPEDGAAGSPNTSTEEQWPVQAAPTLVSVQPSLPPHPHVAPAVTPHRRTSDSYIPLGDCVTGGQSPLDQVPPPPSRQRRGSTNSIPDMPAPPPPLKTGEPVFSEPAGFQTYDHPSKSYVNIDGVDPDMSEEGTYKVPPRRHPPPPGGDQNLYKKLPVCHMEFHEPSSPTGLEDYDCPTSNRLVAKQSSQRDSNSSTGSRGSHRQDSAYGSNDGFYDAPRSLADSRVRTTTLTQDENYDVPPARKTQSEANILDRVPPPPRPPKSGPPSGPTVSYMNLPAHSPQRSISTPPVRPPATPDQTYDFPKRKTSDMDMLTMSPPPPPPHACPSNNGNHRYVNTQWAGQPEGSYMPMDQAGDSYLPMNTPQQGATYTDMSAVRAVYVTPSAVQPKSYSAAPGTKPPRLQSLRAKVQPVSDSGGERDDTYAIYSTNRTRSFKRQNHCPGRPDVQLPVKRGGLKEDTTSDDDSGSEGGYDTPLENAQLKAVQSADPSGAGLPNKKHLNSTPPPPNRAGEVQYLDLDLEDSEEQSRDRSPASTRSLAPPSADSQTDYKEIDFVKTNALCHLKKDLLSVRRTSQRSLDE